MSGTVVAALAAVTGALGALVVLPPRVGWRRRGPHDADPGDEAWDPGAGGRVVLAVLLGTAPAMWWGGPLGWGTGLVLGLQAWRWMTRSRGRGARERDRAVARDLPQLVALMVAPLRSGAAPSTALSAVVEALPGAAADGFREPLASLAVGADPGRVWAQLAADPALGELGQALARSHRGGGSVVEAVQRLADELGAARVAQVENRARTIGVRAAVPLGLCLLPAFLLLGVVPLVAGLFGKVLQVGA